MGDITEAIKSTDVKDPIAKLFDDHALMKHEESLKGRRRGYLGMSSLGGKCELREYYNYRWVDQPKFGPRTLRKFMDGHEAEPRVFERMREMGIKVWDLDDNGNQVVCAPHGFGGHLRGHLDAVARGLPNFHADENVLVDIKISEIEKFKKAVQLINENHPNPLKAWNQDYYGQANLYMHSHDLSYAVYCVFSPGLLDCITLTCKRDLDYCHELHNKAKKIIMCNDIKDLQRVSEDKTIIDCVLCSYNKVCYKKKMPDINCRTCIHAEPDMSREEGKWICKFHKKDLDNFEPCDEGHLYHPTFLDSWATVIDMAKDSTWIKYFNNTNKKEFITGNHIENTDKLNSQEIKSSYDLEEGAQFIE